MHFTKLVQVTEYRSNVTKTAIKVRLASQHVDVAHDDSGSNRSADARLLLSRLDIPVVMVGHHCSFLIVDLNVKVGEKRVLQ